MLMLPLAFYPVEAIYALWILLAAALELVAVVLARRSLGPDPKRGSWRWLAVTALMFPVALLFLPLCGVALLAFVQPWGD